MPFTVLIGTILFCSGDVRSYRTALGRLTHGWSWWHWRPRWWGAWAKWSAMLAWRLEWIQWKNREHLFQVAELSLIQVHVFDSSFLLQLWLFFIVVTVGGVLAELFIASSDWMLLAQRPITLVLMMINSWVYIVLVIDQDLSRCLASTKEFWS